MRFNIGHRGSLRSRLLIALIGGVGLISGAAMVADHQHERRLALARILTSLEEQASSLMAAHVFIEEPHAFRDYVDRFCATMDERISPGHHILVLGLDGQPIASSQRHSGVLVEEALRDPSASAPVLDIGEHRLAQVRMADEEGRVFVLAQYLDHMEQRLREQLIRRATSVTLSASAIVVLVYLGVARWVIRPLDGLVRAARQWAVRQFAARAPASGPSDLQVVSRELNSMAARLETYEQRRLHELEQARDIQRKLLPRLPPTVNNLAIAAEYRPYGHVAGDLYDVFRLPGNRIAIVVLDVSGHGLSSAILTGAVKMAVRRQLAGATDLSVAMKRVNHDIFACTSDSYFVTSCVGIWDPAASQWTYCAAGHPGGVLLRRGRTVELPGTAPLLGVMPDGQWGAESQTFLPGDRMFLYTDGVVDANVNGRPLGLDGLRAALEQTSPLSLAEQVKAAMETVTQTGAAQANDDATILAFEFQHPAISHRSAIA